MSDTNRLQVDILKSQLDELEKLQKLGGLRSKRELWDTAFTLLKWATRKKAQGFSVGSMNPEGMYTELEMPFLEHYATNMRNAQETGDVNDETSAVSEGGLDVSDVVDVRVHANKNGGALASLKGRKSIA